MTAAQLHTHMSRTPVYADRNLALTIKLHFLLNLISGAGLEFTDEQVLNARDAMVDAWSRRMLSHVLDLPLDGADVNGRLQMAELAEDGAKTAIPLALMADESGDITRRLVAFLRPDPKMTIEVEKKRVDTDPHCHVFQVTILDGRGGAWNEVFTNEDALRAFLRGVRVTFAMSDLQKLLPNFGDDAKLEFTELSAVKDLP